MQNTILFLYPYPLWISACSLFKEESFIRRQIGLERGSERKPDYLLSEFDRVVNEKSEKAKIVELNYYHFLVHNVKMKEFFRKYKDITVIHVYLENILRWVARLRRGGMSLSDYTMSYRNGIMHNNSIKEAIAGSAAYHFSLEEMVVTQPAGFLETIRDLGLELESGSRLAEQLDHGCEVSNEIAQLDEKLRQTSYAFTDRSSAFLKEAYGKHMIFTVCMGRTGSNLLISLLNSIPDAEIYGEILNSQDKNHIPMSTPQVVSGQVKELLERTPSPITGAKFLFFHINTYNLKPEHLSCIGKRVSFIHLQRRSILDQYISLQLARLSDTWILLARNRNAVSHDYTFDLDEDDFNKFVKRYHRTNDQIEEMFPDALRIYYEDLRDDCQKVFDDLIFPRLEIPPQKVSTRLRKMNTRQPEEIITNWDKVKDLVVSYR